MSAIHEIPRELGGQLVLLERDAEDILKLADAIRGLLPLHHGGVIIGLKPAAYRDQLRLLILSARKQTRD